MESDPDDRSPGQPDTRPVGPLRRLLPTIRPYRRYLLTAAIVSTGTITAQVAMPELFRRFIDDVVTQGRSDLLGPYAAVALAIGTVGTIAAFARRNASGVVALGVEQDLRNRLYAHLQALSVSFHDGWQSGQLVSRAISDISRIRRFLGFGVLWLFILGQTVIWVMVMMFRMDVLLATVTLVILAPVFVIGHRFAREYRVISRQSQNQQGNLTDVVEETASGVRVIKSYGRGPQRSAIFSGSARVLLDLNMKQVRQRAVFWSADHLLLGANVVIILLFGGLRVVHDQMTLGSLVAFISYQQLLINPVRDLGWIISGGQEAHAAAERMWEILDTVPEIADHPGAVELSGCKGDLTFSGVRFNYPGTERVVLAGLDLQVRAGETLAIVGMTGSGKSTVAALIPRFYDPAEGSVMLDGHDLRSLTLDSLRSNIGVAFEEPILFSASVRENLLMGSPDATDAELWEALSAVQAVDFVRDLPWQLDTRVGEQGHSLSGGQRQRLSLARAVVGRPRVLVLDNPMSSVDVHTEAAIEASLSGILEGRTAILIAHRPSTLLLADRVALIHDGRIVATGTHHDLLNEVPLYREVLAADVVAPEVTA